MWVYRGTSHSTLPNLRYCGTIVISSQWVVTLRSETVRRRLCNRWGPHILHLELYTGVSSGEQCKTKEEVEGVVRETGISVSVHHWKIRVTKCSLWGRIYGPVIECLFKTLFRHSFRESGWVCHGGIILFPWWVTLKEMSKRDFVGNIVDSVLFLQSPNDYVFWRLS